MLMSYKRHMNYESSNFHSELFQMKPNVNLVFVPSLLVVCRCVGVCHCTPQTLELLVAYRPILSALIVCLSYFRHLKTQSVSHDSTLVTLHLSLYWW